MITKEELDRCLSGADLRPQSQEQQVPGQYLGRFFSGWETPDGAKQMANGVVSVVLVQDEFGNPVPMLAINKRETVILPAPPEFFGT